MSATLQDVLPAGYGLVLLEIILICFQCYSVGFLYVMPVRKAVFNKAFYEAHFPSWKNKESSLGYPDTGEGRVADKLSDKDWLKLNYAMRAHVNFQEVLPVITFSLLIGGLVYTRVAAVLGVVFIIGRFFYSRGYVKSGPSGRSLGAGICAITMFSSIVNAVISCWTLAGGCEGVHHFLGCSK